MVAFSGTRLIVTHAEYDKIDTATVYLSSATDRSVNTTPAPWLL
jgi:hypothetical protein